MKPTRYRIADAILDYLHKHHAGEFRTADADKGDRYMLADVDTDRLDLLALADALIELRLT